VSKFGDPFSTHLPGGRPDLYRHGWFTGPRQTAVVNRPLGHTRAVGAVFRTGGAAAVVGVPANVTTGTAIAIDDVLGADAARLRDDLDAAPAWQEELDRFEAFLRARLDPELGRLRRVERAVSELVFSARGKDRDAMVRAWEPDRRLVLESTQGGVTAIYEYLLAANGPATDMRLRASCVTRGALWRLASPLLVVAMRLTDGPQLKRLRTAIERRHG